MEIGNQIKMLRQRRGITQEEMARHFGITAQAVSKWERGAASPDIGMLPGISAYFGVSIDALFALSDDTRMERIQNMLWDVRYLNETDVESSREFLLEKAKREPENGRCHELLADLENHLAQEHRNLAAEYAKEALRRNPGLIEAHSELVQAMGGKCWDWCYCNHGKLIDYYEEFMSRNPDSWHGVMWLIDQLIDDYRFEEAEYWLEKFEKIHNSWRIPLYRGKLSWHRGDREEAYRIWEQLCEEYPAQWNVYDTQADYLARDGRYEEAIRLHRKALEVGQAPRYVDPLESIAQICEIQGDYAGAIGALEEELQLFAREWNFTEGETADAVRREIARLKELAKQESV